MLFPVYYLRIRCIHVSTYLSVGALSTQTFFFCLCTDFNTFPHYYAQDHVEAKVVVAGLSTTCSQKIHNQLVCLRQDLNLFADWLSLVALVFFFLSQYFDVNCFGLNCKHNHEKLNYLPIYIFHLCSSFIGFCWLFFFFFYKIGFCLVKIGVEKMHKDTKYVLFLDDDVRLHPGTIGALTSEMEKNPEVVPKTI